MTGSLVSLMKDIANIVGTTCTWYTHTHKHAHTHTHTQHTHTHTHTHTHAHMHTHTHTHSHMHTHTHTEASQGIHSGAIVGIVFAVVGATVILGILIGACIAYWYNRSKK